MARNVGGEVPSVEGREYASQLERFAREIVSCAGLVDFDVETLLQEAFASVPRTLFLNEHAHPRAYQDVSLPIGLNQHMTRPSVVARMLGLIGLKPKMNILELGSGSGYVSAVLSAAGAQVYAMEKEGYLATRARKTLDALGYQRVLLKTGDAMKGWKDHAPYDAILGWFPFTRVPTQLTSQLNPDGGRLVGVVDGSQAQTLSMWEARGDKVLMYELESGRYIE